MAADHLKEAFEKLSPNYLKAGIPGRETQIDELYNFLVERLKIRQTGDEKRAKVQSGQVADIRGRHINKTMFLCGVPGTGKTATVFSVIHKLAQILNQKKPPINQFRHAYINGQHLSSAEKVYSEILLKFTGETCAPEEAQERLERLFSSHEDYVVRGNRRKTATKMPSCFKIVIIDELDLLYSDKRQNVFYSLFDWPTSSDSTMILIAIANAMDLPERLRGRISSRLGWDKLVFESYTTNCLKNIVRARLGTELQDKCFEKAAITIACQRIGKTTGDARRILDTCRLAIDEAIKTESPKVTSTILDRVGFQNLDDQRRKYLTECGPLELIILKSIVQQIDSVGDENVDAYGVFKRVNLILKNNDFFRNYIMGTDKYRSILTDLAAYGVIYLESDKPLYSKKIYLKDSSDLHRDLIKSEKIKT